MKRFHIPSDSSFLLPEVLWPRNFAKENKNLTKEQGWLEMIGESFRNTA